ncbi:MAG TPA: hypothetical protein VLU92_02745 [Candidatus Dormibacteraeota bacterium]|nr:hypothetical protein [Candidatus Dormibacteraeota bacterium]
MAVYGLISGWTVPTSGLATVVALALFLVAVMSSLALLAFTSHERRTLVRNPDSIKVVGDAARGVSWSSLFAIGISLLLFANCAGNVSSGDLTKGAATYPSQFWPLAALLMLPLVVAIALPACLAIAAGRFAGQGRLRAAKRLASIGLWSAGLLAVVALVTAGVAYFGGMSQCFLPPTSSACAAGVGGLMNLTAIGSLLVIVPYLMLMMRALSAASSRPSG